MIPRRMRRRTKPPQYALLVPERLTAQQAKELADRFTQARASGKDMVIDSSVQIKEIRR